MTISRAGIQAGIKPISTQGSQVSSNRVRDYVQSLPIKELRKIADSWEDWEKDGHTPLDSPLRSHALRAQPEMAPSEYIVQRMRDLAFETFRYLYYATSLKTVNWRHKGSEEGFSLPAGKYWIGDLCYVQPNSMRRVYLDLSEENEGKFTIHGVTFGIFPTKHGDGEYPYQIIENPKTKLVFEGNGHLSVDSGRIGIIPWKDLPFGTDYSSGCVVEFANEFFSHVSGDGKIHFGSVTVDTNPKDTEND